MESLNIVIIGLSITSSWGNGHATVYRGLVRELALRGHEVLFLERDNPMHVANGDLPEPSYGRTAIYYSVADLRTRFAEAVTEADCVIIGSWVQDGIEVIKWVLSAARGVAAFYDLDTPVTLNAAASGRCEYLDLPLMRGLDLYLSFAGGPILTVLEEEFHVQRARPLYCAADPSAYYPQAVDKQFDLGYLGTYAADRQPTLKRLLIGPATQWHEGRFVVAGALYPAEIVWPQNVERISHLSPEEHRDFYNRQRFTLNVTRAEMIRAGFSPSVRLFEAAACGIPVISDRWDGIDKFFEPGTEILLADTTREVLDILQEMPPEEASGVGERARQRVLAEHTAAHRVAELEVMIAEAKVSKTVWNCFR